MIKNRKLLSVVSLVVLLAMTALLMISCNSNTNDPASTGDDTTLEAPADAGSADESSKTITVTVYVTDDEGEVTEYIIDTEATTLRGALEQDDLVQGDEGEYGLYVKTIEGVTADYDTVGAYWAFYDVNDSYLMTSVDNTPIADGDVFKIIYTKG